MSINWPEVIIGVVLGAIVTAVITFIAWYKWKRPKEIQAKQDSSDVKDALKQANDALKLKERDFQEKHGFVPLDVGLKPFEDRICERAETAKKSVKLCLSTPLLYSLKAEPWRTYNRRFLLDKSLSEYWPKEFCEPFRNILRNHVIAGTPLTVELIYLDERSTKKLLTGMNRNVPYIEHKESLEFFIDKVLQNDEGANRALCNLQVHRVMRVPFYLALFDADEASGSCGIVAFANDHSLLSEKTEQNRQPSDMADALQGYEFTKSDVVRFLNQLFEQTKLLSDERLVSFLEICIASGFSWSAIANGIPDARNELIPHATMLHIKETP